MTDIDLYTHFKELQQVNGWDGEFAGGSSIIAFTTSNRNHLHEFDGLCFLLGLNQIVEQTWERDTWRHIYSKKCV